MRLARGRSGTACPLAASAGREFSASWAQAAAGGARSVDMRLGSGPRHARGGEAYFLDPSEEFNVVFLTTAANMCASGRQRSPPPRNDERRRTSVEQ